MAARKEHSVRTWKQIVLEQVVLADKSTYRDNASTFLPKDTPKSSTVVVPELQKGYVTVLQINPQCTVN